MPPSLKSRKFNNDQSVRVIDSTKQRESAFTVSILTIGYMGKLHQIVKSTTGSGVAGSSSYRRVAVVVEICGDGIKSEVTV